MLVALLAANGLSLERLYDDVNLHKSDYRSAAKMVMRGELPGDVVVADDSMLPDTFMNYLRGCCPGPGPQHRQRCT